MKEKSVVKLGFLISLSSVTSFASLGATLSSFSLHEAVSNSNLKAVAFLIERNANLEAKDDQWRTPLHLAAQHGRTEIIRFLIEKVAKLGPRTENDSLSSSSVTKWTYRSSTNSSSCCRGSFSYSKA